MAAPPDIQYFPHERPDLSPLPPDVASRIEDMWRIGGILSRYAYLQAGRDRLYKGLREMQSVVLRHTIIPTIEAMGAVFSEAMDVHQQYAHMDDPSRREAKTALFEVSKWVTTTHSECNRLAAEAKLVYFQMALDRLSSVKKNALCKAHPLLDCLRRVRNVTVHHKPLSLSSDEFKGKFVHPDDPSVPGFKFVLTEAWYLEIRPHDLDNSKPGPLPPEVADWFIRQADRCPLHMLLDCAVVQLCEAFMPTATP